MPEIKTEQVNGWHIIRFASPTLSEPRALERLTNELRNSIQSLPDFCKVVLSFKGVEFVSSQIVSLMLSTKDMVTKKKGTFALARLGNNLTDVLKITNLVKRFTIGDTETDIVGKRKRKSSKSSEGDLRATE